MRALVRLLSCLLLAATAIAQPPPRENRENRDVDIATRTAGLKRAAKSSLSGTDNARLVQEIELFLRDPKNVPKLRPSGAPPGPPV